jgi:hypothetical protein
MKKRIRKHQLKSMMKTLWKDIPLVDRRSCEMSVVYLNRIIGGQIYLVSIPYIDRDTLEVDGSRWEQYIIQMEGYWVDLDDIVSDKSMRIYKNGNMFPMSESDIMKRFTESEGLNNYEILIKLKRNFDFLTQKLNS